MKTKYFLIGAVLVCMLIISVSWVMAQENANDPDLYICVGEDGKARFVPPSTDCNENKETPMGLYSSATVDEKFSEMESRIANLEGQVAELQSLLSHFSRNDDDVYITGANLNIVNGVGSTSSVNGLGNVIIGYNETRGDGPDNRSGSHMLVVGMENNYSSYGGIVAGFHNETSGDFATVTGGWLNRAAGSYSTVTGGARNVTNGPFSAISGGVYNTTIGPSGSISGGLRNTIYGSYTSISGGADNRTYAYASSICGGRNNQAQGEYSSVTGGAYNIADANWASVSGGYHNTAIGDYSSVSGGYQRSATDTYNWAAGNLYEYQ
jgi:hypothetical protein